MPGLISDLKAIPKTSKILLGVSSTWFFTTGLVASWKNLYINLLGGYLLVGMLASITMGVGFLLAYLGGHLGAVYSEKKIIIVSVVCTAIGYALFALAVTIEWLFCGLILMAFSNLGSPCINSLYFGEVDTNLRGLASGLQTVTLNATSFVAPVISTHILLSMFGFVGMMRVGLLFAALAFGLSSALIAFLIHPASPSSKPKKTRANKQVFVDGIQTIKQQNRALRLLLGVAILEMVAYSISSTFEIFIVTEVVGVPIDLYSILLLFYGLFFIPLGFLFGRYADHGRRWECALGFLLLPFVNLFLLFVRGFWQLLVILVIGATGLAAWTQAKYLLITDLTPREHLASVFSVFLTLPGVFAFFVPFVCSLFLLSLSLEKLWLIEVTIFTIGAGLLLSAYKTELESTSLER